MKILNGCIILIKKLNKKIKKLNKKNKEIEQKKNKQIKHFKENITPELISNVCHPKNIYKFEALGFVNLD